MLNGQFVESEHQIDFLPCLNSDTITRERLSIIKSRLAVQRFLRIDNCKKDYVIKDSTTAVKYTNTWFLSSDLDVHIEEECFE